MKSINQMKVSFKSLSVNEGFARVAVASFISSLDPTTTEIADIKTAVSEAVTNCIVHAYRDTIGVITIHTRIYENRRVVITIKDKGCGIENIEKAIEPLFTTLPDEERSGLGFSVMQSFTDKMRVRSKIGRGTSVVLEKILSVRQSANE
ncbi:MAG: anti-sigma F factor [Oscillospiraceae bacterium]|nr:anti-sigma F factor [Oscillospiraceae bacterium]